MSKQILLLKEEFRNKQIFLFGFPFWKRKSIKQMFELLNNKNTHFVNKSDLVNKYKNSHETIFVLWSMNLPELVSNEKCTVYRLEDGFIRSKKLGSDLTVPYSLVLDKVGIYFNPLIDSGLEKILNTHELTAKEREESDRLLRIILTNNISKYNSQKHIDYQDKIDKKYKKIKLVIGQVSDDASIKYGANEIRSNLELLEAVYTKSEDTDFIIFKPHPDVVSGNRAGCVATNIALEYCNIVEESISLPSLLNIPNIEVHTISSLSGFENLLRGNTTICYGNPFYAGWGATTDLYIPKEIKNRRQKKRSPLEILYCAYIEYPIYFDLNNHKIENVFKIIDIIRNQKPFKETFFLKFRRKIVFLFKKLLKGIHV